MYIPGITYRPTFRDRVRARDLTNLVAFGLDSPKKFMTLYVQPGEIRRVISASMTFSHRKKNANVLIAGDWDQNAMFWEHADETEDKIILSGIRARIIDGQPWEATGLYERLERLIEKNGSYDGCRDLDDVVRRYKGIDEVIEFVARHRRLCARKEIASCFREFDGLDVVIGRTGEIFKSGGGGHRLAVAKALDLPSVPVCVNMVHPIAVTAGCWKEIRAQSAMLADRCNHDIQNKGNFPAATLPFR